MSEVLGYLAQKLTSTLGGLVGVVTNFHFREPKTMVEAVIRGTIAGTFSFFFGIPLLWYLGLPYQNWQWQLASGFFCGFVSYALLSAIEKLLGTNFFSKFKLVKYELKHTGRTYAKLSQKSPSGRKKRTK